MTLNQSLVPFPVIMLPGQGRDGGPYAMNAQSLSIEPWPSGLHLGLWGPVGARAASGICPRFEGSQLSLLPSPAFLPPHSGCFQSTILDTASIHIRVSKLVSWATQATTNNYNACVCKEVSLKHSTCKYKLGISNYDLQDEVFELWP